MLKEEVAALFRVEPITVVRWARKGKIRVIKTPGGETRYPEKEVLALLGQNTMPGNERSQHET